MKKEKMANKKVVHWYNMDEVLMWNAFEKQKIHEKKTRPTLYDIFKEELRAEKIKNKNG